jgi:hypothetical protein
MDYIAQITDHPVAAASAAIAIVLIVRWPKTVIGTFSAALALIIFLIFRSFSLAGIVFVTGMLFYFAYNVATETGTANPLFWSCSQVQHHADCAKLSETWPEFLAVSLTYADEHGGHSPNLPTVVPGYYAPKPAPGSVFNFDANPFRNPNIDCRLAGNCR